MSADRPAADDALSIVHVTPYYPPDRIGGVGEVVAHLHEGLLARGHASRVLTSGTGREGVGVVRLAATPGRFALTCAGSAGLTRGADVVHVHHGEALGLILATRWQRRPARILLTLHVSPAGIRTAQLPFRVDGRTLGAGWRGFLNRNLTLRLRHWLDRAVIRASDQLSFISHSSARDVLPAEEADRAVVVYNGLPPAPKPAGERADPTELLYVGTYSTRKRVLLLPFVLRHVRHRRPGARLRFVGFDPEAHPELTSLARDLGVEDGLVFEGEERSSGLSRFYRSSRVLLVPSAYEGLPMVILEAFQNGLPSVATRVGGIPEIVEDGRNGLLVGVDDPAGMAEAALRILNAPGLQARMGENGQQRVAEHFGVDRQVEEYLNLYRVMCGREAQAPAGAAY